MELYVIDYRRDRPRVFTHTAPMTDAWVRGARCPLCPRPVLAGQELTFIVLGPGDDEDAQRRHAAGQTYPAQMVALHATCYDPGSHDDELLLDQLGALVGT